ncbi:hypothetical protein As57867_024206, partial [Aphanomyces stellatus]
MAQVVPKTASQLSGPRNTLLRSGSGFRLPLPLAWYTRLAALLDLSCWLLLVLLMVLQIINLFLDSSASSTTLVFGTSPFTTAVAHIPGNNDDAYIDRAMACVLVGRVYKSMTLAQALLHASSTVVQHSNITADSYTVMVRPDPQTTLGDTYATFDHTCTAIALSIDGILHACADQGYVPVTDTLKINVGTDATHTTELVDALPILILPYWDNGNIARFGVPGQDGVMCSIKLYNMFVGPGSFYQVAVINRADYDAHTRQWLHEPHGSWQNGWYTFPDGVTRYYSHMQNDLRRKDHVGGLGVASVVYDALTHKVVDCLANPQPCENQVDMTWQGVIRQNATELWSECVCIQDKHRNGLVWYSVENEYVLSNSFGLSTVVANISVFGVLMRWGIALLALWRGYVYETSDWHGCGIGIAACSDTFALLPILLILNLKQIFLCVWASSVEYEGDLLVLCNAWYIIYPSLAQFVLLYFAVINWLAKGFRVRMSDRTFGPVLLAFCLGHWFRQSTFLTLGPAMGFTGRAQTLFFASSYRSATIIDIMFTHGLLIGGNVKGIFYAKFVVLAIPLIDLVVFSDRVGPKCKFKPYRGKPCQVETTLAIRANYSGGLGKSSIYKPTGLNGYEFVRLGYLLYGKDNILSFDDYYVAISCYPSALVNETFNQR